LLLFCYGEWHSPVLLKLAEEILNQVPSLIELPVREALCFSVAFGWNHSAFTVSFEPAMNHLYASKALLAIKVFAAN